MIDASKKSLKEHKDKYEHLMCEECKKNVTETMTKILSKSPNVMRTPRYAKKIIKSYCANCLYKIAKEKQKESKA